MNPTNNGKQRAVLVIDADQSGAEELKNALIEGGYRVYTSGNLDKTLKIAREHRVDVALLSLGPTDFDPQRLIKCLQKETDGIKIPVVIIIESFSEELVASALKAGASDYLTRPVDCQELVRRIGVCACLDECRIPDNEYEIDGLQVLKPPSSRKRFLARCFPGLADRLQSLFRSEELLGHRYEKIARLGIGSFGEVWKVTDIMNTPPELFVAKIPISKKLNLKIEKEARILSMLADHTGVPKFKEIIDVKKKTVLIQEFVDGKTLTEVIERDLEAEEVESVIIQLVDVVACAHELGIIHRDIKPGNIMVKPDGSIKLLDFGAAKELKEKDISSTVTGSRPYMSPEQIMGKSQRRSDVWALGVIMYELYTGMLPFYNEVEKVLMDMILELPVPSPKIHNEDLNPKIEEIILTCLEKNTEERYPDAGALKSVILANFPDYGCNILPLF
ncbi:MAG: protein kinase [Desulfobacterales bacterium]